MNDARLPVSALGKQAVSRRLAELWERCFLKARASNEQGIPEFPPLGPRAFALWPSPEFVFYCDPDAPLKHMQTVVVLHERKPCFWAYVKTKHPDRAKVLQIGWPGRSAGCRYRREDDAAEGWQIASVVVVGRMSPPHGQA